MKETMGWLKRMVSSSHVMFLEINISPLTRNSLRTGV